MLRKALLVAIIVLLTGTSVLAQAPSNQERNRVEDYAIRGNVVIPIARDVDHLIEVKLEKPALKVIQATYTDASGNFDFRNLSPGAYYVAVNLEGYEPVHQLVEI